jgi:hypothetical protein
MRRTCEAYRSGSPMPRKSEATRTSLLTYTPAALPPMASTRGRCAAARRSVSHDAVEVILGILLEVGVPAISSVKTTLPSISAAALAVAAAEVEADAAAVQMTAQRAGGLDRLRKFDGGYLHEFEGASVDAPAHVIEVPGALALGSVDSPQQGNRPRVAGEIHAPAALLPEQEFEQAVQVQPVEGDVVPLVREDAGAVGGAGAVAALQAQAELGAGGGGCRAIGPIPEHRGKVAGVEHGGNQGKGSLHKFGRGVRTLPPTGGERKGFFPPDATHPPRIRRSLAVAAARHSGHIPWVTFLWRLFSMKVSTLVQ